jgi:hypothetical protein
MLTVLDGLGPHVTTAGKRGRVLLRLGLRLSVRRHSRLHRSGLDGATPLDRASNIVLDKVVVWRCVWITGRRTVKVEVFERGKAERI